MNKCACGCGKPTAAKYTHGHNCRTGSSKVWYFTKSTNRWQVKPRGGGSYLWYRIVMWNEIGRELHTDEVVHHINGDPGDDRVENLRIVSPGEHMALHRAQGDHAEASRKFEEARQRRFAAHRVTIVCATCGASVERPRHRVRSTHNFCSPACSAQFQRARVQIICDECGGFAERTPSQAQRGGKLGHFCSNACKAVFLVRANAELRSERAA